MNGDGMAGWRGTGDARGPQELEGGIGLETQGGNGLPCQPSNFSNRRKLVTNNCWVGGFKRKNTPCEKSEGYIFGKSTFAIPIWSPVLGISVAASWLPVPTPDLGSAGPPCGDGHCGCQAPSSRPGPAPCSSFLKQLQKPGEGFTSLSSLVTILSLPLKPLHV